MENIKKVINDILPFEGNKIILDNIKIEDLINVKMCSLHEGFEKFTCRPVHNMEEKDRVERYKKMLESNKQCILGIYDKKKGNIAGHISIFDYNPRNKAVEMGYYLIKEYRNNGYMKEAVLIFNEILFKYAALNKVMAQTGSFNVESNALLQSCGFKLDGSLRNHHELKGKFYNDNLYSILNYEYLNMK